MLKASGLYASDIRAASVWGRDWGYTGAYIGENAPGARFSRDAVFFIPDPINWHNEPRMSTPGWTMQWGGTIIPADYTNALVVGAGGAGGQGGHGYYPGGVLSPNQASLLDSKYDDGGSNTGRIIGAGTNYNTCSTASSAAKAPYVSSNTLNLCGLVFLQPF